LSHSIKTFPFEIDLLVLQNANPAVYPYLLESAAHGHSWQLKTNSNSANSNEFQQSTNTLGRYSILFAYPQAALYLDSDQQIYYTGQYNVKAKTFLRALDELWQREANLVIGSSQKRYSSKSSFPFRGGWFVYCGYELAQEVEPSLKLPMKEKSETEADNAADSNTIKDLPIAFATRVPVAIIVDHQNKHSYILAETGFANQVNDVESDIHDVIDKPVSSDDSEIVVKHIQEDDPAIYMNAITKTHAYIHDGDIFQANLSREWRAELDTDSSGNDVKATTIYKKLREANPGPFAGLAHWGKHAIVSSSPERLIKIKNQRVDTRPIAGTRARSTEKDDDEIIRQELIKHPKERAEHIMLIDLERNDLGRICQTGSVKVDELMVIETYEHVHHIVSNVTGRIKPEVTPGQALKAVFPGGTITGCPKVRCMEIIAELEDKPREAYTGSMGYLNHNGDMDMNILIRTIQMQGQKLHFRAGGGIVYDSNAEREVHETRAKARGMLKALQKDIDVTIAQAVNIEQVIIKDNGFAQVNKGFDNKNQANMSSVEKVVTPINKPIKNRFVEDKDASKEKLANEKIAVVEKNSESGSATTLKNQANNQGSDNKYLRYFLGGEEIKATKFWKLTNDAVNSEEQEGVFETIRLLFLLV